jgi:hypothetical protein
MAERVIRQFARNCRRWRVVPFRVMFLLSSRDNGMLELLCCIMFRSVYVVELFFYV